MWFSCCQKKITTQKSCLPQGIFVAKKKKSPLRNRIFYKAFSVNFFKRVNNHLGRWKKEKRAFHPIPKHLCVGRTINMNEKALRWLNKWNTPSRVCGWETRDTVFHHISNIEKRDENTMRNGVILMNTEVFRFWVERRRKDVEYGSFNHISKQVKV